MSFSVLPRRWKTHNREDAEHSFPAKGRWREDAELETASERKRPEGISAEEVGGTFLPAKGRWREDAELE